LYVTIIPCSPRPRQRGTLHDELLNSSFNADTFLILHPPEHLARFYGAVIQGMSIQALDGAGTKALRGIAETALKAWPGGRKVRSER
jgi:hypothetical protein